MNISSITNYNKTHSAKPQNFTGMHRILIPKRIMLLTDLFGHQSVDSNNLVIHQYIEKSFLLNKINYNPNSKNCTAMIIKDINRKSNKYNSYVILTKNDAQKAQETIADIRDFTPDPQNRFSVYFKSLFAKLSPKNDFPIFNEKDAMLLLNKIIFPELVPNRSMYKFPAPHIKAKILEWMSFSN